MLHQQIYTLGDTEHYAGIASSKISWHRIQQILDILDHQSVLLLLHITFIKEITFMTLL